MMNKIENIPEKTGIINLWELPITKIYVNLGDVLKQRVRGIITNIREISKELGIKYYHLYNFFHKDANLRLDIFLELCNLLKKRDKRFSKENLQRELSYISAADGSKGIRNPRFPMNFNCKEGAAFIAGILCDGGIHAPPKYSPFYTNTQEFLRKNMVKNIHKITGNIRFTENKEEVQFTKILGYILTYGLKMKAGNKLKTDPEIPPFILDADKKIITSFLRQAADDDFSSGDEKSRSIKYKVHLDVSGWKSVEKQSVVKDQSSHMPKLLHGACYLLSRLGIKYTIPRVIQKENNVWEWGINITLYGNIKKFDQKIGFRIKSKKNGIKRYLSKIRLRQCEKSQAINVTLKACKLLQYKYGYINAPLIARQLNRKINTAEKLLCKLRRDGVISEYSSQWKKGFHGARPIKYVLCDE